MLCKLYFLREKQMEEKFWDEVREEFPVTKNLAYFNSAGMSPIPNRVLKAITSAYESINQFGDMHFMGDLQRSEMLRGKLADMIHTHPQNICFAENTSTAFSLVAASLKRTIPFDFNIVSLMDEFPSTNVPFEFQGIPMKFVEPVNGAYSLESIVKAVDEKTMAVVCSHVQYATGFRVDIEKLGNALKDMDLLFIVNATQSFPVFEIDVQKSHIDVLSVSFHKWNFSGLSGSLFYTSESFRQMYPNTMAGWLSVHPPENEFIPTQKNETFLQLEDAGQYNFGGINFHALAGLDVAMDFIAEIGREKIRERILSLTDYLVEKLKDLDLDIISPRQVPDQRSGIVLVSLRHGKNAAAVEYLMKHKVVTAVRAGKLRISCNFFNNYKEIDNLIEALGLFCEIENLG
jgi:cysteine desulfurase / selenocysteine lyase